MSIVECDGFFHDVSGRVCVEEGKGFAEEFGVVRLAIRSIRRKRRRSVQTQAKLLVRGSRVRVDVRKGAFVYATKQDVPSKDALASFL